jgi:hypothetical protein
MQQLGCSIIRPSSKCVFGLLKQRFEPDIGLRASTPPETGRA